MVGGITTRGGRGKGRIVADGVRRRTILHSYRCLRGLKCRLACLSISTCKIVSLTRLQRMLQRSAALISIVAKGGRVKAVRPLSTITSVLQKAKALFRASTIRTVKRVPLSVGRLPISCLDTDTRGFRNPGKINFLFIEGSQSLPSCVRKNDRRGNEQTKARGITKVIKVTGTLRVTIRRVRIIHPQVIQLHGCFIRQMLQRVPRKELGKRPRGHLPKGIGFDFRKVSTASLLMLLRRSKVYTSTKSTYGAKRAQVSRIVRTVRMPGGCTPNDMHFAVKERASHQRISTIVTSLGGGVKLLHNR